MVAARATGLAAITLLLAAASSHAQGNPDAKPRRPLFDVSVIEWDWNGFLGKDLNDHGQVASTGNSLDPDPTRYVTAAARRYDPKTGFVDLGAGNDSYALSINNRGDVAGFRQDVPGAGYRDRGFLCTHDGGVQDLGSLGGSHTWANSVNDRRQVAGYSELPNGDRRAFLWDPQNGMENLGVLPGGRSSAGVHVTEDGTVVGYAYTDGQSQHAFLWTRRGGMNDLGTLPGGERESAAFAANDKGRVVGYSYVPGDGRDSDHDGAPDPFSHAFLWTDKDGMRDLGTLRPGDNSIATDINKDGTVVGFSVPHPGGTSVAFTPFLWSDELGMLDLNDLLTESSDEWNLYEAARINDRGEILVKGTLYDRWATVLLSPAHGGHGSEAGADAGSDGTTPEPGSSLLITVLIPLFLRRRR